MTAPCIHIHTQAGKVKNESSTPFPQAAVAMVSAALPALLTLLSVLGITICALTESYER